MIRRLLAGYLSITVVVLAVLEIPFGLTYARTERDHLVADLERDATAIATFVEDALERGTPLSPTPAVSGYAPATGTRLVIVDRSGRSILDSGAPPGQDFTNRPEIATALAGRRASGTRRSRTAGGGLLYVAVPVASSGVVHGAVRLTYPTATLDRRVRDHWLVLGSLAGVTLAAVAVVGIAMARWVAGPVRDLEHATAVVAAGDLAARAPTASGPPEVQSLARSFNAMAERLQQLVAAQQRFVADASHQLRTPLTALRLRLENAEAAGGEAAGADLAAAQREVDRLSRIVDQLLVLARAGSGRVPVVDVDVGAVLADRAAAWGPVAASQGVAVAVEADGVGSARALTGAVDQILDNLLANALAVSPPGSTVVLRAVRAGPQVELHVVDRGPGMTDEERALAFARFWRAGDGTGSGLGLAIVRELAEASGGRAGLDAVPGGGLDAWVRLPVSDDRRARPT